MRTRHPEISVCYLGDILFTPRYASDLASGADLYANIKDSIIIGSNSRVLIPTGISLEIPVGYEAQIRSRSGLCLEYGIVCLNSPGTIDADYRGEIKVILANFSQHSFVIEPTMRIAQIVFAPVVRANFPPKDLLDVTQRSSDGFGSTGMK